VFEELAAHQSRFCHQGQLVFVLHHAQRFNERRCEGGDLLRGAAGDWLLQYAPGDWGIVEDAKFLRLYRACPPTQMAAAPPAR